MGTNESSELRIRLFLFLWRDSRRRHREERRSPGPEGLQDFAGASRMGRLREVCTCWSAEKPDESVDAGRQRRGATSYERRDREDGPRAIVDDSHPQAFSDGRFLLV